MQLNEYGDQALRTARLYNDMNTNLLLAAIALNEEAGEFSGEVKHHVFHDHPLDIAHLIEELGDILWYLNYAARSVGSNLEEVASLNLHKLAQRYPDGFSTDASLARRDKQ